MSKRSKAVILITLTGACLWVYFGPGSSVSGKRVHVMLDPPSIQTLTAETIHRLPPTGAGPAEPSVRTEDFPEDSTDTLASWSADLESLLSEDSLVNTAYDTQTPDTPQIEHPWFNARKGVLQQCEGQPEGFNDNSAPVLQVYSDYIPAGASVHCSRKDMTLVEGRKVYFVYIVYGDLRGCDPHCYASQLCAINDGGDSFLFSAHWYAYEEPINLIMECPDMADDLTGNTNLSCNPRPSGYSHPATTGNRLSSWYSSAESNVFRFCFL